MQKEMECFKMAKSKLVQANEKIAENVVNGYKKIEESVVGGYKKIEDQFVDNFLIRDRESVKDAKARLRKNQAAAAIVRNGR